MRSIGFSTGALAYSDFQEGLRLLRKTKANAVELSALRQNELDPLVQAIDQLDLGQFGHISVHVPSSITPEFERTMLGTLRSFPVGWLLIAHPDVITMWNEWEALGSRLCIENMDKRKPIGQTARGLSEIFGRLPEATFCLDIGHAHQIDPTMGEAVLLLEGFSGKLRQLHVSEVNSDSKHDPISVESASAFSVVAHLIPESIPVILESRLRSLTPAAIQSEMDTAEYVLDRRNILELAGD